MAKNPLHGRHRDVGGRISQKHGNTKVGALRSVYGADFASGHRSDAHLKRLLDGADAVTLSQCLRKANK